MAKHTKQDRADAIEQLGKYLNPSDLRRDHGSYSVADPTAGSGGRRDVTLERCGRYQDMLPRVFFLVRSVAKSGMSRRLSVFVVSDGDLARLDWAFSIVGGYGLAEGKDGFRIDGCGMDMGFAALEHVAREAFGLSANDFRRGWL
jgi:hypothetical protein